MGSVRFHVAFHVVDRFLLIGGFFELEGVFEFALPVGIGREGVAGGHFALGIQLEKFLGHVADGFADARLARFPDGGAEAVERGRDAAERLIFLNQVEASERDVELGVLGVAQEHEFAVRAFDRHLAQAFELADAVVHVDDEIAGLEIGEIAEEAGRFWARAGALRGRRKSFEKIRVAVDGEIGVGDYDAFAGGRFDEDHSGNVTAVRFFGKAADGNIFFEFTETVGHFIFVADVRKALELTGARGRDHYLFAGGEAAADFSDEGGDVTVIAGGGLRVKRVRDLALDGDAEMLEREPGRELKCERPLFVVEEVAIGGLAQRVFGVVECDAQALAVLFDGRFEERGFVLDNERIAGEIEESGLSFFEQDLLKLPAG